MAMVLHSTSSYSSGLSEQKPMGYSGPFNTLPNELISIIFQFLLEGDKEGPVLFNRVLQINKDFYGIFNSKIHDCFSSLFNIIRFNWTHLENAAQRPEAEQKNTADLIEKLLKNNNCLHQINFDFLKTKIINTTQKNEKAITKLLGNKTCQEIIRNGFFNSPFEAESFLITLINKKKQEIVHVLWKPIVESSTQLYSINNLFQNSLQNDCYELSAWILETNRSLLKNVGIGLDNSSLLDILVKPGNKALISKFPFMTHRTYSANPYSMLSLAIRRKKPEVVKELLKNRTVVIDRLAFDLKDMGFYFFANTILSIVLEVIVVFLELILAHRSLMSTLLLGKIFLKLTFVVFGGLFLLAATIRVTYHLFQLAKAVFFLALDYFFVRTNVPSQ